MFYPEMSLCTFSRTGNAAEEDAFSPVHDSCRMNHQISGGYSQIPVSEIYSCGSLTLKILSAYFPVVHFHLSEIPSDLNDYRFPVGYIIPDIVEFLIAVQTDLSNFDSLLNQIYKNLEIILVDDGSADSSFEICREYEKKDPRVKAVHKENGGVSSARNVGLKIASGEYIGFIDSDDYIAPEMYADLVDLLNTYDDLDGIKYQLRHVSASGDDLGEQTSSEHPGLITLDSKLYAMQLILIDHEFASAACFLFRKSKIKHTFNEKINMAEDYLFLMHYIMHVDKVFITNNVYYNYVYNQNSIMHSYTNLDKSLSYLKSQLTVCRIAKKYIENYKLEELKESQVKDVYEVIRINISRLFPGITYSDYKHYIKDIKALKEFRYFNRDHKYDSLLKTDYPFYLSKKTLKSVKGFVKKFR